MSAIAGIFYIDGRSVPRAELESMVAILAHRGPDACGTWSDGQVGFGHRLLQTTPESLNERQPLADAIGDLIITADARLDNPDELLATLGLPRSSQDKVADAAIILAAYERWGERCPEYLHGDFAFAIYDRRSRSIFCARDRFGVKPFYYHSSPKLMVFATEIKALLELPETPRRLNETRVADYLASAFDDTASTFYQEIYRLPPAHSITVSQGGKKLHCYWSLDPSREIRFASVDDYGEAFRELFTQAVDRRLRSSYPVGSLLSGGLDSSAITCTARDLLARRGDGQLNTFSAIFDEVTQCDERFYINAVLSQNGVEPHYVHGDQLGPLTDLERVLWHQDEPLFAFNHFLNWNLYTTAARRGVRVILDGFDGDTTVSHGTGYLSELATAGRWLTLATEARGLAKNFGLSPWKIAGGYLWHFGLKRKIWIRWPVKVVRRISGLRGGHGRTTEPSPPDKLYNPEFAQRIGLVERLRDFRKPPPRSERMHHHRALNSGVLPYSLEVLDRSAAAFSIEPRYPFWDQQLVEFCLALPAEQKIHKGWTRMVMRRALSDVLPAEVQWRGGKSNLGPNFQHTLLAFEQERLDDVILTDPGPIEDYVDTAALRQAYARFLTQPTDDDTIMVWKGATLALWLRQSNMRP